MHGYEDYGDPNAEVDSQSMPEEGCRHEAREDGGHGGGVLLQYGVSILEEEG